jgi:hypothetical protein
MNVGGSPEREFFGLLEIDRSPAPETATPDHDFAVIQRLLVESGPAAAVRYCVDNSMWEVALLLAHSISELDFARVAQLYVTRTFTSDSMLAGALAPRRMATSWRFTLANALFNPSPQSPFVLDRAARAAGDPQAATVITPFIKRRAPERPPPPEKLPPTKPPKSDKPAGQQGRRWAGCLDGSTRSAESQRSST